MAETTDVHVFMQTGDSQVAEVGAITIYRDGASHAEQLAEGLRDMADAIEVAFG